MVLMALPCCVFFGGRFSWAVWANMFLQDLFSNIVKIDMIYQSSCDHIIRHFSPARDVFGQIRAPNQLTLFETLQLSGYPLRIAIPFFQDCFNRQYCLIKAYS